MDFLFSLKNVPKNKNKSPLIVLKHLNIAIVLYDYDYVSSIKGTHNLNMAWKSMRVTQKEESRGRIIA